MGMEKQSKKQKKQKYPWRSGRYRKCVSVFLTVAMAVSGIAPVSFARPEEAEAAETLQNPRTDENGVTTWDCVWFGNYWQNDTNGDGVADRQDEKEPIKWRILSVDGDDAFLISEKCLDVQVFNMLHRETNTWAGCTVRSWLNGYGRNSNDCGLNYSKDNFLNNAFNEVEQDAIQSTEVITDDSDNVTENDHSTTDKVYLLSAAEASNAAYGFPPMGDSYIRYAHYTEYALWQGAGLSIGDGKYGIGAGKYGVRDWWLRSTERVGDWEGAFTAGNLSKCCWSNLPVRPALHLKLSASSLYSYAGTLSSDGTIAEEAAPSAAAGETQAPVPAPTLKTERTVGANMIRNPRVANGVSTWDCIWFGHYWQDAGMTEDGVVNAADEKKPIKWRVLSVNGDDAFLLADRNLRSQPYHREEGADWEHSILRAMLNDYESDYYYGLSFKTSAFSEEELRAIRRTTVINDDNPDLNTTGGNNTQDWLYLLSVSEASNPAYGFDADFTAESDTRVAVNTDAAKLDRVGNNTNYTSLGSGYWWLRSVDGDTAACVNSGGRGSSNDASLVNNRIGLRPVLHLDLSCTDQYQYAGTVSSNGECREEFSTVIAGGNTEEPAPTAAAGESTEEPAPTAAADESTEEPASTATADIEPQWPRLQNPCIKDGATIWDCVWFGHYWQRDTNGDGVADRNDDKRPIKWRVLSAEGDDLFLLADQNLDSQQYNVAWQSVKWDNCTLRSWLNGYGRGSNLSGVDYSGDNFLKNAFSSEEQAAIKRTDVVNGTLVSDFNEVLNGGPNTVDQVYLLSSTEASTSSYGFRSQYRGGSDTRLACNTAYTEALGAWSNTGYAIQGTGTWWIRAGGRNGYDAGTVGYDGFGHYYGTSVHQEHIAVRPALHLKRSATDLYSYAGTVSSRGNVAEEPAPGTQSPATTSTPAPEQTPVSDQTQVSYAQQAQRSISAPPAAPDGMAVEKTLEDGDVLASTDASYLVEDAGAKTVLYKKTLNKKSKQLTIPDTVELTVNGSAATYKVIGIARGAFSGCGKLKKIVIGKNVRKIENGAFKGCKALQTVVIRAKKLSVAAGKAFRDLGGDCVIKVPRGRQPYYNKLLRRKGLKEEVTIK